MDLLVQEDFELRARAIGHIIAIALKCCESMSLWLLSEVVDAPEVILGRPALS